MIQIDNADCMDLLLAYPDNYFDIAIVDPPYFSGPEKRKYYGNEKSIIGVKRREYPVNEDGTWKIPTMEYYFELVRVSKQQIIWGINYFDFKNEVDGRIVWDKVNGESSFSDCEIASCSIHDSVRLFSFMWNGMMQGKSIGKIQQGNKKLNEVRIHPTQKPVKLYEFLLYNYSKEGDKVLDTHMGSGSLAIACHNMNRDFYGTEINSKYFEDAKKRIELHQKQLRIRL